MEPPQNELLSALARLYQSGRYSDLTIICNNQRYNVHKALLCSRSHFFDGACSSRFGEATSGEINMSEEDEEVLEHLIHYFYYLDYDADALEEEPTTTTPFRPSMASRTKKLDMSLISDPLMGQASTLSPPASRSNSPNDRHSSTTPSPPSPPQTQHPRAPKTLSRRALSLRHRARAASTSTTNPGEPPLTPASSHHGGFSEYSDTEMDQDSDSASTTSDSDDEEGRTSPLLLHARLYSAAEKYGIPGLKALSKRKFEALLFPPTIEAFNASALADPELREVFLTQDFPAAMEEVYTGTVDADRGLRNAIVQAFRAHPEWGWKEGVGEVVRAYGALAWDLYRAGAGMPTAA